MLISLAIEAEVTIGTGQYPSPLQNGHMMTNRFAFTAANSARWLPHRINPLQGRLQFVQMTRASYENNSFLDDRLVQANDQKHTISIPSASQVSSRPTVDFIFHGAFCGSALLSRCLDIPGSRLAVREPLILRQDRSAFRPLLPRALTLIR